MHMPQGALLGQEVCFPKPKSCSTSALALVERVSVHSDDLALLSKGTTVKVSGSLRMFLKGKGFK